MKSLMIFFTVVLLFLYCVPNAGSAEEILTWEDCVKEAERNHPDLISAQEVVNQAKADKAIATSTILPQISTELNQSTSKTSIKNRTDTYAYGVTAQQLFFDGLKTPYDIAAAAKDVKSAHYNYEVTSSDIRLRLRTAFIELLKAQELLVITEDIFIRRKQNADLVRLLYEGGREHRGSLLTAQANLAQAEFEVAQAKRYILLAQRQLTRELGRTECKPIRVRSSFADIKVNRVKPDFETLAARTPSFQALTAKKEAARFDVKSARGEFFPQVYARASAGRTDTDWPPRNDEWSVGVTLTFPLFEGGRRWAEVSKAKAVLRQAEADERGGRDNVIVTLEEAWTNLQNKKDAVEVQRKFLHAAEERAKIAQAQYSNGLISFDNWIIIEDDFVRAQKTLLDAQAAALIAEAEWIHAQGGQLEHVE